MKHHAHRKIKKLQILLSSLMVAVVLFGAVGFGFLALKIGSELQGSIIRVKSVGKKRLRTIKNIKLRFAADSSEKADEISETEKAVENVSCDFLAPEKSEYKSEFITNNLKVETKPGDEFEVNFYVKNAGNVPWFGEGTKCGGLVRLGTAKERDRMSIFYNPRDPQWKAGNRIAMKEKRVNPGDIATFSFSSKAPRVTDIFKEYFQPVVEAKRWMETNADTGSVAIVVGDVGAEEWKKLVYLGQSMQASSLDLSAPPMIEVNISDQTMTFKFGETVVRKYLVSTGSFNTPTPIGTFKILEKMDLRIGNAYPHYRMPYFQGFTKQGAGFHALPYLANDKGVFWTEALSHIGMRVSHGCVRILDDDAEDFFGITEIGMPVVTHY